MGIAVLAIMLMAASQTGAPPDPPPPAELPVSVERIREGLQRPALKVPPIESLPVFRVTVEAEAPLDNPLQGMRRELATDSGAPRKCGPCDVWPLVMGMVHAIKSAYRAHAEAEIRKEVQAALDAFCGEHDCSVLEDGPLPLEGIILPRIRPSP